MDPSDSKESKRPRLLYDIPARRNTDEKGDFSPIKEPTVQSTIREPKSRDETIAERKKNQKAEDGRRWDIRTRLVVIVRALGIRECLEIYLWEH